MKQCSKCKEFKDENEFNKDKLRKDGLAPQCRGCAKKYRENNKERAKEYCENNKDRAKEYRENNKEKIMKRGREYYKSHKEKLSKQKRQYYKNNKEKILRQNKEYYKNNKERIIRQNKGYYKNNKERIARRSQEYNKNHKKEIREYCKSNKEKRAKYNKEYRKNNKITLTEKRRRYKKNRFKTDINFKLSHNLRSRIRTSLKNNSKSAQSIELLGCTVKQCRTYLEKQFQVGMSWKNYGVYGWHIDHLMPCISFDLSDPEQQKICFHYTNLQPLWAKDNLSKGSKIINKK